MNAPATLAQVRPDDDGMRAGRPRSPSTSSATLVGFDTTSRDSNLALIDWVRAYLARSRHRVDADVRRRPAQGQPVRHPSRAGRQRDDAAASCCPATPTSFRSTASRGTPTRSTVTLKDDRLYGRGVTDMKSFLGGRPVVRAGIRAARPSQAAPLRAVVRRGSRLHRRAPPDRRHRRAGHAPGRLHRRRADRHAARRRAQGQEELALPRARLRGALVADAARRQRGADRLRDRRVHRAPRARIPRRRPQGRGLRRSVHDRARRHDPRRHRAQHRAARLHVRLRDPPPAVRRSRRSSSPSVRAFADDVPAGDARGRAGNVHRIRRAVDAAGLRHARRQRDHALWRRLQRAHDVGKVSFGTEASLFHGANVPTVICGPGHIAQAHQPNEWVSLEQIARCEAFMRRLADQVCATR